MLVLYERSTFIPLVNKGVVIFLLFVLLAGCQVVPQISGSPGPDPDSPSPKGEPGWFPDLAAGAAHSCLLTTTGRVVCWGGNQFGQLGGGEGLLSPLEDAPTVPGEIPGDWIKTNVRGLAGRAIAVRSGYYHTCALVEGGGVQCWGRNAAGQAGDGTTVDRNSAVSVQALNMPVSAISLGASHSCALLEAGEVRCWGENEYGQLGDGGNENSSVPRPVQGLDETIVQIAAGGMFTCALSENGNLYCWGNGSNGRFGDGRTELYLRPLRVEGLEFEIDHIAAGDYHLCARTTSGDIQCWGALSSDREYTARAPLLVKGLTGNVSQMAPGSGHTCALTDQDTVKCWGDNYFGQLGDGTDLSSWEPVDVVGRADGVLNIASGTGHVCALLIEGGVTCWGDCSFGQCGDRSLQWAWSTYTNQQYYFSVDYPPGWNVMEVPNADYPSEQEQVWFTSEGFPPPGTGARADITLLMTQEDPGPQWEERFFDDYQAEAILLGNVPALRISGRNKESLQEELAIIVQVESYYILALPNQSAGSIRYFDEVMNTLTIAWELVGR